MSERKPPSGTGQPQGRGAPSVKQEVLNPASASVKQEAPGSASPPIKQESSDPASSSSSSYNTPALASDQPWIFLRKSICSCSNFDADFGSVPNPYSSADTGRTRCSSLSRQGSSHQNRGLGRGGNASPSKMLRRPPS